MYNRAFPAGNALFLFTGGVMSLLRLPRSKFSLAFLAVPTGKDGRVECPCQTVDDFIRIRGSVCGLFLFVQTHAPLDFREQHTMCLLLCCLLLVICECSFQRSKVVLVLLHALCILSRSMKIPLSLMIVRGGSTPCCRPLITHQQGQAGLSTAGACPFILTVDCSGWLCYF